MGEMLGPYEIRGELGRGAMAIVWRGFDPKLEREVAVKEAVVSPTASAETAAELADRFVREGRAAAALNHPGIVTIHAADVFDGRAAIVMELIEGETLASLIDRGPLSPGAAAGILDQLLDAVAYAHARGVVHRDIKPDNIFVTHDGRVKLTDFGIAHVGSGTALTQAGTIMGTPGYMAPEQVTGQPVDARADIFAIGVIGYELLTGRNPFGATQGEAPTTIMYRIVHEQLPDLTLSVAGLDPHLGAVIAMATQKDPGARFGSAEAMRAALLGGPMTQGAMPVAAVASGPVGVSQPVYAQPTAMPRSGSSMMPYVIVGMVGLVVVGGLLVAATKTPRAGGGGSPVAAATATAEPAKASAPAPKVAPAAGNITGRASVAEYSSYQSDGADHYPPEQMIDGIDATCWAEGVGGLGEGEWVTFAFDEEMVITSIRMIPGYQKQDGWDRWGANGRVKQAQFSFDSGSPVKRVFEDKKGFQKLDLNPERATSTVTMKILSTRPHRLTGGHGGADTSVSEIQFWGYPASAVSQ